MRFNFNDKKSQNQIAKSLRYANDVRTQNGTAKVDFESKWAKRTDSFGLGRGDEINGVPIEDLVQQDCTA